MHSGQYISGAGHLGLIAWLLLGGLFTDRPDTFELTEVSVISGADFDAMVAARQAPQSATEVAQPETPDSVEKPPQITRAPDTAIEQPAPVQVDSPPEDTPPQVAELPPEAPAEETPTPPDLSEPVGDIAELVPETAPEAAPRPVARVAPEPVAPPEPEAEPDAQTREAVAPDAAGEAPEQEPQEATAPEEAVAEIVTEATNAPARSNRPPGKRPAAPAPRRVEAPEPSQEPAGETGAVDNDDVLAALAAAQEAVAAPSGPPLSAGEKDALRAQIAKCWNIGSLSTAALGTTVIIGVRMNSDATPVNDSIRMIGASGGSDASARRVYDSARRAIILCGARGYDLPADKFDQWQNIEMTFDPSKMGY